MVALSMQVKGLFPHQFSILSTVVKCQDNKPQNLSMILDRDP